MVRVYKRYIGTPEATQTFLTETLSKAREFAAASVPSQLSSGFYRQLNTPGVYYLSGQDACSVTFEQMNIIGWDKLTDVNRNPAESKNFNGTCTSAILPNGYYRHRGSSGVVRVFEQSACGVTFDQMNAAGWDKVKDIERDPAENRNYIGTCQ